MSSHPSSSDASHAHGPAEHRFSSASEAQLSHLQESEAERRIDFKIVAVLAGGVVLVAAVVAQFIFETPEQGELLAILASILLGGPIVFDAALELLGRDPHQHEHGHGKKHQRDHAHDHEHEHGSHHEPIGHTHGSHMLALIALAILASFAAHRYFEAAAVAFFMLLAEFIESRTAVGAAATIESLVKITPTRASKLTGSPGNESESEVDAKELRPGDRVVIRPGDLVPGDGIIRDGSSTLDQAKITGESLPVEKAVGDEVFSGTIN